ncbi:MAG: hypothetical protein ABW121_18935 [Candidatus Thiodiazotropha sp. 6PLUC7]
MLFAVIGWVLGFSVLWSYNTDAFGYNPYNAYVDVPNTLLVSSSHREILKSSANCQSGWIVGIDHNAIAFREPQGGGPIWCHIQFLHKDSGWIQEYKIHKYPGRHSIYPNKGTAVPIHTKSTPSEEFKWIEIDTVYHNNAPVLHSYIYIW